VKPSPPIDASIPRLSERSIDEHNLHEPESESQAKASPILSIEITATLTEEVAFGNFFTYEV
jgi:hypothetical protein